MVVATHHEGDVVHLDPALDMTVLGVGNGKVKLGLSSPQRLSPARYEALPRSERVAPESHTATIAIVVARVDDSPQNEDACVACELHGGLVTVHGRAPSYYLSQPGHSPMLVVTCEENQRIRINDTVDIVVLDIHDTPAGEELDCPSSIHPAAHRLFNRLRQVQDVPVLPAFESLKSHTAFST